MRRGYRRYGGRGTLLGFIIVLIFNPATMFLFLLNYSFFAKYWLVILLAILAVSALIFFLVRRKRLSTDKTPEDAVCDTTKALQTQVYFLRSSLMSNGEWPFFHALKKIVGDKYIVQPQVNLASIIEKTSDSKYRNELFRNIDFCIFDNNYKPLVLVEINDATHMTNDRKERDQKVKNICAEAKLPLITLWTKYGVNETYIQSTLASYLALPNDIAPKTAEDADSSATTDPAQKT